MEDPQITMTNRSGRDAAAGVPWSANTHVHLPPNFSAFQSVAQAVELAAAANVKVLGASNYYDFEVYRELERLAGRHGIYPLFGLEVITRSGASSSTIRETRAGCTFAERGSADSIR
jgi:hypothetical protein